MGWYTHVIHGFSLKNVINAVKCFCVVNENKNHTQALFLSFGSHVGNFIACSVTYLITSPWIRYLLPHIDLHSFFYVVQEKVCLHGISMLLDDC